MQHADILSCPFCNFTNSKSDILQAHVETDHQAELKTPTKSTNCNKNPDDSSTHVTCPLCCAPFSVLEIEEHFLIHHLNNEELPTSSADPTSSTSNNAYLSKQIEINEMQSKQREDFDRKMAEELELRLLQKEFSCDPYDKITFEKQASKLMNKAVGKGKLTPSEYYSRKFDMLEKLEEGLDDNSTATNCISQLMVELLRKLNKRNCTGWILVSPSTNHYGRGPGDSGWGCGFRNIQMMLSSMVSLPVFRNHLARFVGKIPSIPKLQSMIEEAWSNGFDPSGKEQLQGKLVGTRKWIGATEAFALFASLGLHCNIVDFQARTTKKVNDELFKWVLKYFSDGRGSSGKPSNGAVKTVDVPLLYLQHQGHSRSIAGLQFNAKSDSASRFIILDPGDTMGQVKAALNVEAGKFSRKFLKTKGSFNEDKYQIVSVVGIASDERMEQQKDVDAMAHKIFS